MNADHPQDVHHTCKTNESVALSVMPLMPYMNLMVICYTEAINGYDRLKLIMC